MIETIPLAYAQEQTFTVLYGETQYNFSLGWNDFQEYWIMDIYQGEEPVYTGLPMFPSLDVLAGFEYLGMGRFFLIDTTPDSDIELDPKLDLGDRLKLIREYDA